MTSHTSNATESEWRLKRADARRNQERIKRAAALVFREFGLSATIPQIAERAGVGKATVYRSYPTKNDLIEAVSQAYRQWFGALVKQAAQRADEDAFAALVYLITETTTRLSRDRFTIEVLSNTHTWRAEDETTRDVERILDLGREQGTLRADATLLDLQVMVGGFARSLREMDVADPAVWSRYAQLAANGLRP